MQSSRIYGLDRSKKWVIDNLIEYAAFNDSYSINSREVVVKAFGEYNHNPQPREVARE